MRKKKTVDHSVLVAVIATTVKILLEGVFWKENFENSFFVTWP